MFIAPAMDDILECTSLDVVPQLKMADVDQICNMENVFFVGRLQISWTSKHLSIILLIDFEKAFDTIHWTFLKSVLKYYGFNKNFQRWISILYSESESCVINKGMFYLILS